MSATEVPCSTLRVLVVEDSPDVRFLLVTALEWAGYEVVGEAGKARQALELIARTRPDVVVLDLDLPGRNGLWLLPRLQQASPGTRAVVVSGDLRPEVRERAIAGGAAALLGKGEAHSSLASTIADVAAR